MHSMLLTQEGFVLEEWGFEMASGIALLHAVRVERTCAQIALMGVMNAKTGTGSSCTPPHIPSCNRE